MLFREHALVKDARNLVGVGQAPALSALLKQVRGDGHTAAVPMVTVYAETQGRARPPGCRRASPPVRFLLSDALSGASAHAVPRPWWRSAAPITLIERRVQRLLFGVLLRHVLQRGTDHLASRAVRATVDLFLHERIQVVVEVEAGGSSHDRTLLENAVTEHLYQGEPHERHTRAARDH